MTYDSFLESYGLRFLAGPVAGSKPVRFMFMDEAGTSANEPVSVVVGLIVHPDRHIVNAEKAIADLLADVPIQQRSEFSFQAEDIWSDKEYRDVWTTEDRHKLIFDMMSIPKRLGIPVAVAWVRRDWEPPGENYLFDISKAQNDHMTAFLNCIELMDGYVRNNAEATEVATIVAEDVPDMKRMFGILPQLFREMPEREAARIERIRPTIHWVNKSEDKMVHIADACAFGFRRFILNLSGGKEFIMAITDEVKSSEGFFVGKLGKRMFNDLNCERPDFVYSNL